MAHPRRVEAEERKARFRELWDIHGTRLSDLQYANRIGVGAGAIQSYRCEMGFQRPKGPKSWGSGRVSDIGFGTTPLKITLPSGEVLEGPAAEVMEEARRRREDAAA